ncbi:hypothetical protein B0H11DRAFT_2193689 [Mycena galericulata]|nr:hypothetical protein B0H11DRAFT_2193689 [Mycena galericulata]
MKRVAPEIDREAKRQHLEEFTGDSTAVFMDASHTDGNLLPPGRSKDATVHVKWPPGASEFNIVVERSSSEPLEVRLIQKQGNVTAVKISNGSERVALEIADTTPPMLTRTQDDSMDIDDQPDNYVPRQSAKQSEPTHPLIPLYNIGNLSPTTAPREHSSVPLPSGNHASTSQLLDLKAGVPAGVVKAAQPLNPGRPVESGFPRHNPSAQTHPMFTAEQDTAETSSKKQRKNKARKEKRKIRAGLLLSGAIPPVSTLVPPPHPDTFAERSAPTVSVPSTSTSVPRSIYPRRSPSPRPEKTRMMAEAGKTEQATCLQMPSGFSSLSEVKAKSKDVFCSVIGVVTSITGPFKTTTGAWTCSIYLVDPTDYGGDSLLPSSSQEGFRVNCFMENYQQWLPKAETSDIIILHKIRLTEFNGQITANGYYDRLQWAVCSKQKLGHGNCDGAPQSEGYGVSFTPFYQATPAEFAFCLELTDWWRGVTEKRTAAMGTINQIGGDFSLRVPTRTRREHKLLSGIAPGSFFDCTVEVLSGHQSGNLYSLYVTDFTAVSEGKLWQEDWCPRYLPGFVLRIEMWDAAAQQGPTMNAGGFYLLRNVLMRRWKGYAQGKLVENKIHKLELSDAEHQPHLKALLERRNNHPGADIRHEQT